MKRAVLLLLTLALCAPLVAQDQESAPGLYVILDGSGSMWGQLPDGTHKITAAREVLQGFREENYAGRELAFRVYGHRREADCSDSELVVPFSDPGEAIARMAEFADEVNPTGRTPISRSLRAALEDFGDRPGDIILISDGIETCDEDPCALMREWRDRDVNVAVHVVGLGLQAEERTAMQCISEAAGTAYHDAQSVDELMAGLEQIRDQTVEVADAPVAGDPGDGPEADWRALDIIATNADGETMRVFGTATWDGGDSVEVTGQTHNMVPPGEIVVTVGVRTRNGNLYEPVTRTVTVAPQGETDLEVIVAEPPTVSARFVEAGEERRGSLVTAYQDGEAVFTFRSIDTVHVDPGAYEFRAIPNADNELSVAESFAPGDRKQLVFELVQTVRAVIKMVAAGSGLPFRTNYELWQDGQERYGVHWANGVQALPGVYDVHLPLRLTPYVHAGLEITAEPEQEFLIEVPAGHVTVRYQKADGTPERDERIFLSRKDNDGKWVRDRVSSSGERIPLVPGEYELIGWDRMGTFDPVYFEIAVGDELEFNLRDKGE